MTSYAIPNMSIKQSYYPGNPYANQQSIMTQPERNPNQTLITTSNVITQPTIVNKAV